MNLKNKSHCREKNFSFPKPRVPNLWNLGISSLCSQMSHMRPHTQSMAERTTGEFHCTLLFLGFKETSFVTVELHICFLKLLNAGSSWTVKRCSHKVYTFWVCTAACSCEKSLKTPVPTQGGQSYNERVRGQGLFAIILKLINLIVSLSLEICLDNQRIWGFSLRFQTFHGAENAL